MATSASRSLAKRTTPVSCPLISANFTSPTSRNLSRSVCQVQEGGILRMMIVSEILRFPLLMPP
uniref:Uncharacterized protein n=1 Tax=Anopheles funestus TaxID=62324 RepID=A0A182S214_ANOFN